MKNIRTNRNEDSGDHLPSTPKMCELLKSPEPKIALEAKLIRNYDLSPRLRQEHDEYMAEYRECLVKICSLGNEFSEENKRIVVDEYVRLTVKDDYSLKPQRAYQLIEQELIALLKQDFKFKSVPIFLEQICIAHHTCGRVIEIVDDDLVNPKGFYCKECYGVKRTGYGNLITRGNFYAEKEPSDKAVKDELDVMLDETIEAVNIWCNKIENDNARLWELGYFEAMVG